MCILQTLKGKLKYKIMYANKPIVDLKYNNHKIIINAKEGEKRELPKNRWNT